ncbi:hypothetical protein VUJ49_22690 [Pseudomonas berkeleyensis]|uniref:Uncharacterized protein n=1 Tax=Pseudomonas berkeleyensis TaxID=2726956 RepID=A0A7G5DM05_9PSED|nr:hypothetical protein [Pseudomonas berkeleyensis]QMV62780.1 hypothetical protein HS968_22595 [Pseudomonas berkeleyensis]WSO38230.1 hypothetical protein VUJ49_22690 [Pseudomonas berkeleyensis]
MKTVQSERAVSDLKRLVNPASGRGKALSPVEPKGAVAAKKGRGNWDDHANELPPSGGVASPLIEQDYNSRERWGARTLSSVDGLLSFRYRPIKQTHQVDANGAEVVNQWAEPPL